MKNSKGNRQYLWIFACGGILLGGIIIIGVIVGLYFFTPFGKTVPSITILQPQDVLWLQSGQTAVLVARGEARSGIQSIGFLVNDMPAKQVVSSQGKQTSFDAVFPWYSSQPGIHKLSIVAYDTLGTASQPESVLAVVTAREDPQAYSLESTDGNTTGSRGSEGQQPSESNQGQSSGPTRGDQSQPGASVSEQARGEIEEVFQNMGERDEFPVILDSQPADDPPAIDTFEIQFSRDGNQVNGTYIIEAADDIGLTYVTFSFAGMDDPMNPASTNLTCGGERNCAANGNFHLPQGGWVLSVQAFDTSGQASEIVTRLIHVLEGDAPLAVFLEDAGAMVRMDPLLNWGVLGPFLPAIDDIGTPRIAEYGCSGQIIILEIPYTYQSNHGDTVYLEARAENGPVMVAAGNVPISPGSGVARLEMEAIAPDLADSTDQLQLHLMAPGGNYFYQETAELPITWPLPQPDLRIRHAAISEALGGVTVENIGCASVDGFFLRLRPVESEDADVFVEESLAPGSAFTWNSLLDPNLYSRGFQAIVDPDNYITEINENNNSYDVGPLRIKRVHIHSLEILNTSDDEWTEDSRSGEFYIYFRAGDQRARRPRIEEELWILPKGVHTIGEPWIEPVILNPQVNWDEDLFIQVRVLEDDDLDMNDIACWIEFYHSHDAWQESSWKRGGEFHKTDNNNCKVFWRIDLEQ